MVFVYISSSWLSSPTETDSHFSGVTPLTSWLDQMLDSDSVFILRKPALAAQALSGGLGYLWQTNLRSISLFHEDPPPPEAWESQLWFWANDSCISLTAPWQRIGDCWSIPTAPRNAMWFPCTDISHSWELASSTVSLGTIIFRNTAASDFYSEWHLHCHLFHKDLAVKPSSSLHCVQHVSHVQPSRAPLQCSCVLGFDTLVGRALATHQLLPQFLVFLMPLDSNIWKGRVLGVLYFPFLLQISTTPGALALNFLSERSTACPYNPAHSLPGLGVTWLGSHLTRSRTNGL